MRFQLNLLVLSKCYWPRLVETLVGLPWLWVEDKEAARRELLMNLKEEGLDTGISKVQVDPLDSWQTENYIILLSFNHSLINLFNIVLTTELNLRSDLLWLNCSLQVYTGSIMEGVSLILQVLRFTCKLELVRLRKLRDALHQLCNLSLPLKLYSCQHTVIFVVILGALL